MHASASAKDGQCQANLHHTVSLCIKHSTQAHQHCHVNGSTDPSAHSLHANTTLQQTCCDCPGIQGPLLCLVCACLCQAYVYERSAQRQPQLSMQPLTTHQNSRYTQHTTAALSGAKCRRPSDQSNGGSRPTIMFLFLLYDSSRKYNQCSLGNMNLQLWEQSRHPLRINRSSIPNAKA